MSSSDPSYVEKDNVIFRGPNELPSYDELAAHNGPNSRHVTTSESFSTVTDAINDHRFGRWRGWIEKRYCGLSLTASGSCVQQFDSVPLSNRARERYADLTPEEYERRRTRGWELVSMTGI